MQITREDVKRFPRFLNHESARSYLRGIYGKYFVMSEVERSETGEKIYYYSLVNDKERYLEWREALMEGKTVNDALYQDTYQACMITESGKLTVFYDTPQPKVKEG